MAAKVIIYSNKKLTLLEIKNNKRMKVTIIAGARPNFMKIAPLMRAIQKAKSEGKNISARIVYTGSADEKSWNLLFSQIWICLAQMYSLT